MKIDDGWEVNCATDLFRRDRRYFGFSVKSS